MTILGSGRRGCDPKPVKERFIDKIFIGDGCWEWCGSKFPKRVGGYGFMMVGSKTDGSMKSKRAHRLSFEFFRDAIPSGLHVLHKCDNPLCVNPNHLFLGTHQDNMADMRAKGRHAHGEMVGGAKSTADGVREIRRRYAACGVSQEALGSEYGVSQVAVSNVIHKRTWEHIK